MRYPAERYVPSTRPYTGLPELDYPFHDRTVTVTTCGRVCFNRQKINLSTVFAGQSVGIKQVSEHIWLVSFMDYDLGYFDHETCRLEPPREPLRTRSVGPVPDSDASCGASEAARERAPTQRCSERAASRPSMTENDESVTHVSRINRNPCVRYGPLKSCHAREDFELLTFAFGGQRPTRLLLKYQRGQVDPEGEALAVSHRRAGIGACRRTTTHARRRRSPNSASNSARPTVTVRPSGRGTAPPAASTAAAKSRSAVRCAATSDSISRMSGPTPTGTALRHGRTTTRRRQTSDYPRRIVPCSLSCPE